MQKKLRGRQRAPRRGGRYFTCWRYASARPGRVCPWSLPATAGGLLATRAPASPDPQDTPSRSASTLARGAPPRATPRSTHKPQRLAGPRPSWPSGALVTRAATRGCIRRQVAAAVRRRTSNSSLTCQSCPLCNLHGGSRRS
eukprot:scaffold4355_cov349-Prasinococcus_capsulatus_cf.AAC.1